jgi:hypothetical protein
MDDHIVLVDICSLLVYRVCPVSLVYALVIPLVVQVCLVYMGGTLSAQFYLSRLTDWLNRLPLSGWAEIRRCGTAYKWWR